MFDNKDICTLRLESVDNKPKYFMQFKDSSGVLQDVEISQPVYAALETALRKEENQARQDRRRREYMTLSDIELYKRVRNRPKTVIDIVDDKLLDKQLAQAIAALPKMLKRRFILYYGYELTYEQIAKM